MSNLRDYQLAAVDEIRTKLFTEHKRSVVSQLPTGAGKTVIVSNISKTVQDRGNRVWFIVPRKELVKQSKEHFTKCGISFGIIDASHKESRAYKAHIISLQTLMRRLDKIKEYPDLVFIDECHVNYDAQKKIFDVLPKTTKIIGLTATPERLDNRGLGTLYDDISYGASIPYLTQCGFLSLLRYYAPPTDGIQKLKFRSTGEVDQNELDKLLTERAIYGRAVDYYEKLARQPDGSFRRGVGFCAGVKAAQKQATEFQARGIRAEYVDGKMPEKKQRALLDGLSTGQIDVLCSADLLLYGWDSPKVSYGFLLRRTKSKALYFQIVGRILRIADGKPDAIFVDHTATVDLHTDINYPGIPPFYLDHVDWNFNGKGKGKEKSATPFEIRSCPYDNYRYCEKKIRCAECEKYVPNGEGEEKIIESIPLQERIAAMTPHVITTAEKREYQDAVLACVNAAKTADDDSVYDKAVKELCEIADKLDYRPMWVYYRLSDEKYTVNTRALHSIAKAKNYKPYWAVMQAKKMNEQLEEASA
jgi:DNA repair protein RadD